MIENPSNFADQFKNFIEHIAGLMKTYYSKSGGAITGNVTVTGDITCTGTIQGATVTSTSDRSKKKILNVYLMNMIFLLWFHIDIHCFLMERNI